MNYKEFLERFVFVRKCGGCGEILSYEHARGALCPECTRVWHIAKAENCPECLRVVTECTCAPRGLRGVRCLRKLFFYHSKKQKEPQNRMLYLLKHHPNRRISRFVASELAPALRAEISELAPCEVVLVHVPRGRRAVSKYGFDQSELVCRALAELCGYEYLDAIGRSRGGVEQKKLKGASRFGNVKGVFYLKKNASLSGKCVVLFDDVVTTGASMAGCVKLLKKAGAKEILAFCIAQD